MTYANEGAEKAKIEEEVSNRKRKVEQQAKWEGELHLSTSSSESAVWRVLRISAQICRRIGSGSPFHHTIEKDSTLTHGFLLFVCLVFLLFYCRTTRGSHSPLEGFQHKENEEVEEERARSWIAVGRSTARNLRVPPLPIPPPCPITWRP